MVIRVITEYEKLKTVYVSIPKVANTSIKTALMKAEGLNIASNPHAADIDVKQLEPAEVTWVLRRRRFVFGFVRNPWDRLVSAWADKCGENSDIDLTRYGLAKGTPFERFIEVACDLDDKYGEIHFKSQANALLHNGCLIPSYIGRFETLDHHWEIVRAVIKSQSNIDVGRLAKLRSSDHRAYRDYYTPRLAMMVERRYQTDVSLFGYKF